MPHWAALGDDLYWYVMLATMMSVGVCEVFWQARSLRVPVGKRWASHAFLYVIAILIVNPLPALSGMFIARWASATPWGFLNSDWLPFPIKVLSGLLFLDLSRYAFHFLAHRSPLLWRFHQVHHNDEDLDISTGLRFHPVEIVFVLLIQTAVIAWSAMPPFCVLLFGVATAIQSLLAHANLNQPAWLDRTMGKFWITPNFHHIHHSMDEADHGANLGVIFPWWDHCFRTFKAEPTAGWAGMQVGLGKEHGRTESNPMRLLLLPFEHPTSPESSTSHT